jgi:hypothetical protein
MIGKLRLPLVLFALAILASSAHAQFSAYGLFSVDRMSGIASSPVLQTLSPLPCTGTTTTNCTAYNDFVNPLGFTGGVSYDFKTIGAMTLAADLRASTVSSHLGAQSKSEGAGAHLYSYLGGVRASFRTPKSYLRPYAQGSVGYARTNYGVLTNAGNTVNGNPLFPGIPTQNDNIEYHVYGGLDIPFLPYADWRFFEAGYGAVQSFGTFAHTYPVYSVSTGIVFHFPPR